VRSIRGNARQALNTASDREDVRATKSAATNNQRTHVCNSVDDHVRLRPNYIDHDVSGRTDDVMRVSARDVSSSVDSLVVSTQLSATSHDDEACL